MQGIRLLRVTKMTANNPQLTYIFLILPALFGICLIVEGFSKVIKEQWTGLINITLGFVFIGFVIVAYFMFHDFLIAG